MKLFGYFKAIAQFPHQLRLKANGKESHSTCLTLSCTLLVILLFLAYFPSRLYNFITQRPYNLNIVYAKTDPLAVNRVDPHNIHMIIIVNEMVNQGNSADIGLRTEKPIERVNKKQNTVSMESYTSGENNKITTEIEEVASVEKCDSSTEILKLYQSFYEESKVLRNKTHENYCLKPKTSGKIGGLYFLSGKQHYTIVHSNLQMTHSEEDKSCPYLGNSAYYGFVYKNYVANYESLANPVKASTYSHILGFEGNNDIAVHIRLRKTVITTGSNFVGDFFEKTKHEFFTVDRVIERKSSFVSQGNALRKEDCQVRMRFYFEVDDNVLEVQREYEKLDNFIANSTGFIGFFVLFLKVIVEFLEDSAFERELIKKLYFTTAKQGLTKSQENISDRPSALNLTQAESGRKIVEVENEKERKDALIKEQLSRKALRYFEYDSDLMVIVRKILLFEALIKVLLTDEQLKLLNLVNVRKLHKDVDMDKQIKHLEDRFPMPGKMDGVEVQMKDIPGEDYLTSRILDEIKEN